MVCSGCRLQGGRRREDHNGIGIVKNGWGEEPLTDRRVTKNDVLVIPRPIVSDEPHARFRQSLDNFTFYPAGDADALESAVDGPRAVERARAAFLEEIRWVAGFGRDELGEGGEGVVS